MSTNERLLGALSRHQLMIQRLASGEVKRLLPILDSMQDEIVGRLMLARTDYQLARFGAIQNAIEQITADAIAEMSEQLTIDLEEIGEYEADFFTRMIGGYVNVDVFRPSVEVIRASLTDAVAELVSGDEVLKLTVPEMVRQFSNNRQDKIANVIREGIIAGDPIQETIKRLANQHERTKRQAGTLIRTATNHVTTQARKETTIRNADILDGEEWVSVLDKRTSAPCRANDGKIFPVGEGRYPPIHYGCRSVRVPVVKNEYALPVKGGTRASSGGQVDASKTYNSWLKDQSVEFQNDVLGVSRARLFRKGMHVDKFVDDMGRTLTLAEIKEREGITLD